MCDYAEMDCLYTLAVTFHVCTLPIKKCFPTCSSFAPYFSVTWSGYHVKRNEKQADCVFGCIDGISVYPHLFVSLTWNS